MRRKSIWKKKRNIMKKGRRMERKKNQLAEFETMRKQKKVREKRTKEVSETLPPFSLDRPQSERKTNERLVEVIEKESTKSFRVEKGKGTPLKDIPNGQRKNTDQGKT